MSTDNLVIESLKDSVYLCLRLAESTRMVSDTDVKILQSILDTIDYYSNGDDYGMFLNEISPQLEVFFSLNEEQQVLSVKEVRENKDGSADIVIECDSETKKKACEAGFQFFILKGILECYDNDELLRWVLRGKQEEKLIGQLKN